jgi:hypothetical protein
MFFNLNNCRHKFGKVELDGFQYCEECGTATKPSPVPCDHKWVEIATTKKINDRNRVIGFISKLRCSKCGELKEFRINV